MTKLPEGEEKYRTLFETAPLGITTLDMKGVITSCNYAVYKEGGYSPSEIIGKHFSKIVFGGGFTLPYVSYVIRIDVNHLTIFVQ